MDFRDLMIDQKLMDPSWVEYQYEIVGPHYKSGKTTIHQRQIILDRRILAAAMERSATDQPVEIRIWTRRQGKTSPPVTIAFQWSPAGGAGPIPRTSRG